MMRRIPAEFRFHVVFAAAMLGALIGSPALGYFLGPH